MRVGRKPKIVEPKRTRSCVVRLEKVRAPLIKASLTKKTSNQISVSQNTASTSTSKINSTRAATSGINSKATKAAILIINPHNTKAFPNNTKVSTTPIFSQQDDKKFKGPLKKRPLAQTAATPSPKVREKPVPVPVPVPVARTPKQPATPVQATPKLEETPTIAAGRSRRAIKPNPKYASDDIVTPKIIKHAAQLTPASNRKSIAGTGPTASSTNAAEKRRKLSTSSSEDLYNKDSSDADYGGMNDILDEKDSDSDFSDFDFHVPPTRARNRARPTLPEKKRAQIQATPTSTKATIPKSAPTPKALPSHLQQLRKTIAVANANRMVGMNKSQPASGGMNKSQPASAGLNKSQSSLTGLNKSQSSLVALNKSQSSLVGLNKSQSSLTGLYKSQSSLTALNKSQSLSAGLNKSQSSLAAMNKSQSSLSGLNKSQSPLTGSNKTQPPMQQPSTTMAKKRKLYESSNDSDSDSIAKRRKVYTAPNMRKDTPSSTALPNTFPLNHKTLMTRKSLTANTTLNGSKIASVNALKLESDSLLQKRKISLLEKAITNRPVAKTLPTKTQNPIEPLKVPAKIAIKQTAAKPRTASPAPTAKAAKTNKEVTEEAKPADVTPPSLTVDDFETMPTFTIVNINDIINKKGDVLISKAASTMSKTSKDSDTEASEAEDAPTETEPINTKPTSRRKPGHTKILMEKVDAAREKRNSPVRNTSFTPPSTKKPAQTILNHTLSNKNMSNKLNPRTTRASNSAKLTNSSNKPAPRILNSMVAKKTQPVKPLIANLDDSADETFSTHPMDDDDDDIDAESDEEEEDEYLGKSHAFLPKKSTPVVTKENSLAATNRQMLPTMKAAQRKISPEKVVISRQGDKIIKKITCFETWYIINLPDDRPAEVVRNQLDMPLIKLANSSKKVDLPTSNWSSKVTLYQLAVGALSKANYTTYTGDLHEHHILEEDRGKYQPSCVMFRRAVTDRNKTRLPYDRAVIFKNKTFYTNIEGKNVKLVGAPFKISSLAEVEILLQLVDELTLQSSFVEQAATVQ